jgi:hypothetical protein
VELDDESVIRTPLVIPVKEEVEEVVRKHDPGRETCLETVDVGSLGNNQETKVVSGGVVHPPAEHINRVRVLECVVPVKDGKPGIGAELTRKKKNSMRKRKLQRHLVLY